MKRLFLLLFAFCVVAGVSATDEFVRISSLDDLTEDGEYVIGAKGTVDYPYFYLLHDYDTKKKYFKAVQHGTDVPQTLSAPDALVWHVVRQGSRIVLSLDGAFVAQSKGDLIISSSEHTTWEVQPQPNGSFKLTDGTKYLHIRTQLSTSYFKCLSDDDKEGTLLLYKRTIPLPLLSSYARFWETDGWETLCLPFSCPVPQGFAAYAVRSLEGETLTSEPVSFLEAGVPYVVRGQGAALFAVRKARDFCDRPQPGCLTGTYVPCHLQSGYVLDGTDFVPAAAGCYVPPFCAYRAAE